MRRVAADSHAASVFPPAASLTDIGAADQQ